MQTAGHNGGATELLRDKLSWRTACTNELRCSASKVLQLTCMTCENVNYPALGQGPNGSSRIVRSAETRAGNCHLPINLVEVLCAYTMLLLPPHLAAAMQPTTGEMFPQRCEVSDKVQLPLVSETASAPSSTMCGVAAEAGGAPQGGRQPGRATGVLERLDARWAPAQSCFPQRYNTELAITSITRRTSQDGRGVVESTRWSVCC